MKISSKNRIYLIRQQKLSHEEHIYNSLPGNPFHKEEHKEIVTWIGFIERGLKRKYEIKIVYDENYPFIHPKVYPIDIEIAGNLHQNVTSDGTPGDICLFLDGVNHWQPVNTCDDIITQATKWFRCYENNELDKIPSPPEIDRYYPNKCKFNTDKFYVINYIDNINIYRGKSYLININNKYVIAGIGIDEQNEKHIAESVNNIIKLIFDYTGLKNKDTVCWYYVNKLPIQPYLETLDGLISFINANSKEIINDNEVTDIIRKIIDDGKLYIGLVIKTKDGDIKWIFYKSLFNRFRMSNFRNKSKYRYFKDVIRNDKIGIALPNHIDKKTLFKRIDTEEFQLMDNSIVIILGCGTIGSKIAEYLIKCGLGTLLLIDNDTLKVGNVCRHVLGLNYVGQNKAEAMKQYLNRINPFAKIEAINDNVLNQIDYLSSRIKSVNTIISCAAKDNIEFWLNQAFINYGKPIYMCRTYPLAVLGDLLISREGKYCYNCFCQELKKESSRIPKFPEYSFEDAYKYDNDCGSPFIPASAVDIDFITLNITKKIIDYLLGKDIRDDYFIIRGRELQETEKQKYTPFLHEPYKILSYKLEPATDCSSCIKH